MLDETLVIWGGEFGRTSYSQGPLTETDYGRDHHPKCFSIWMAGGGVKKGMTYGKTDDYSYNIVENPVHVHDFQATIMHLLGIDHERLNYKFQGRRYRLTDVHGKVVKDILVWEDVILKKITVKMVRINWTTQAKDDLRNIFDYISFDSEKYAGLAPISGIMKRPNLN